MQLPPFSRLLNILIGLGVFMFVATLIFPILLADGVESSPEDRPVPIEGTLGEEGASCGGAERLPCQPGFVCKGSTESSYGICMTDEREALPAGKEGEVCGGDRGCGAGLLCNAVGGANGVCVSARQAE
ncbi:MAG: hypothetical protein RL141_348 [Candidatus Parcubacteria bacterium]|jgi:hypothetical protein